MLQRSDPNYLTLDTHYSNTSHTTHTYTPLTYYSHYWHTHRHLTHCSNTIQICSTKKRTNSHLCPRDACQPQGKAHMRAGLLCMTRISPAHTPLLIFVRYTILAKLSQTDVDSYRVSYWPITRVNWTLCVNLWTFYHRCGGGCQFNWDEVGRLRARLDSPTIVRRSKVDTCPGILVTWYRYTTTLLVRSREEYKTQFLAPFFLLALVVLLGFSPVLLFLGPWRVLRLVISSPPKRGLVYSGAAIIWSTGIELWQG